VSTGPADALATRFDPAAVEAEGWRRWEGARAFETDVDPAGRTRPGGDPNREPFTIVIPPPNITGRLHMGHALNNTIQDVLIRYRRMEGRDALWVPGTDHAGISTQTVVRKHLDAQGIDYRALGRDAFIERVWEWREEFGGVILEQLRKLGCSCDLRRTRFTMDDGLSRAVRTVFKALYDRGLIYRGKRVVNWCPVDRTALSDDEVETAPEGEPGHLWSINYPLADDPAEHLTVATTRPETLFGDVAVAVHPEDPRYRALIGRQVQLPLTGRVIPVIADSGVERDFGTGCLKITPAHDPHDFEIGQRHGLEPRNVMNEDATLNDQAPEAFRGLDRYEARGEAVAALEAAGLLKAVDPHQVPLGRAQRSGAPIEYRLSDQWFVRMRPLADRALRRSGFKRGEAGWEKVREGELRFHPARWEQVYARWLIEIRDWTISRQIWWGHRIPAWHHRETGAVAVGVETPPEVLAEPAAWRQDEDVLDTWFSSWLWPMSTLGWPDETPDLARYFPTSVLSTDKGILFFWVARMNFAGIEMTGRLPYRDVYIHPTVLDERGAVMSKSKGNGVDPLAVIDGATLTELKRPVEEARPTNMKELLRRVERNFPDGFEGVGADALRFTLVRLCSEGQEMRLSLSKFHEIGRRFLTKLWNASRFTLLAIDELGHEGPMGPLGAEDRWIVSRAHACTNEVRKALDNFDFAAVGAVLYRFVWNDFCDWYMELAKVRLRSGPEAARRTAATLGRVLSDTLHLLHPVTPFVTEHLYARLRLAMERKNLWGGSRPAADLLARSRFPASGGTRDAALEERFEALQRLVSGVRKLRADAGLPPDLRLRVSVRESRGHPGFGALLSECREPLCTLARLTSISVGSPDDDASPVEASAAGRVSIVDPAFEAQTVLGEAVDLEALRGRVSKQLERLVKERTSTGKRLSNPGFVAGADPAVVEKARGRFQSLHDQTERLRELAGQLGATS
jgi:valyl-tRNA synthetase